MAKHNVSSINGSPMDGEQLPEYFAGLPLHELRRAWVACIVDAVELGPPATTTGDIARALLVVRRRLCDGGGEQPAARTIAPTPHGRLAIPMARAGLARSPARGKGGKKPDALSVSIRALTVGNEIVVPASHPISYTALHMRIVKMRKRGQLSAVVSVLKQADGSIVLRAVAERSELGAVSEP